MSRVRYQPYPKRLPLVSVDEDRFSGVFSDLEKMNIVEGKICTFDHHIGQWIEVPRPQRVSPVSGKIYDIAASGFDKYWTKYEGPILCPHKKRTGGTYDPLVLCLQGNYEGRTADFYRALDHSCCFKVVIPPLKEKKVLITWEERCVHAADQDHDQDEDEDDLDSSPLPLHAPQGKNRSQVLRHISSSPAHPMNDDSTSSSQSSQSASNGRDRPASQSSTTSVSSSGSTISTRVVEAIVRPHPRSSGPREPTPTKLRATPLNIGGGTVLQGRSPRAYYGLSVAEARKQYDSDIMSFVQDISASGLLQSEPTVHPAWNPDSPPTVLELYDDRIYPACRPCMNDNLDFLYLPLGQVLRDMNSVLGVPYSDYAVMVRSSESCRCCLNHFSPHGYEHHRREGLCTNHPKLESVPACEKFDEANIRRRSFRENTRPVFKGETLETAVGRALLAWNSRLGVPADVWVLASTAVIHCDVCDLTRTFAAHLLHLDGDDNCNDPGQAVFAPAASP